MIPSIPERARTDLAVTLALLALLLWWDVSGWDMALAQWFGDGAVFALRDRWWTRGLLHDGGRVLSGIALAACAVFAWRAPRASAGAPGNRLAWFGLVLACLLLVPALKQLSRTSCPWDLEDFGGAVPYVPHWMLTVFDDGPGRCFPSGHAVAAFAFLPLYFQWRRPNPALARSILVLVLGIGALFGWAQLARGAHFPSHTLWSAWLCWVIGAIGARALERASPPPPPAPIAWAPVSAGEPAASAKERAG